MRRALAALCCGALALCAPAAQAATPWRQIGPPAPLASIAFSAVPGSSRVYGVSPTGVWRSDDNGATWTQTAQGLAGSSDTCRLATSPIDPNTVYSGCGSVSTDGGVHWHALPTITGTPQTDAAGTLYWTDQLNAPGQLQRCTPDASACTRFFPPNGENGFFTDPASTGLLAKWGDDGLTVSGDGGTTWSAPRTLPAHLAVKSAAFDGRVPRKLILVGVTDTGSLAYSVSADAGLTWTPARAAPLAATEPTTVSAGGSGAQRRIWLQSGHDAAWTSDDGTTFHAVHTPLAGLAPTVDPNDGAHLFQGDPSQLLYESRDGGVSWALRNSSQFGRLRLYLLTGGNSTVYGVTDLYLAWVSHDSGLTWTLAPGLSDQLIYTLVASRDNPDIAYAAAGIGGGAGLWRTVDGGRTWAARTVPPGGFGAAAWIESGHPERVFASNDGGLPFQASHDGGLTWADEPIAGICFIQVTTPAGGTRGQAGCGSGFAVNPALAPWDQAFDAAEYVLIDHTGSGAMYTTEPLGRINADWSFDSMCDTTRSRCFAGSGIDDGLNAWVAGGHATFAFASGSSLSAMRDGPRVWALAQPAGSDRGSLSPLLLLSHSELIANGLLVTLEAPPLDTPTLSVIAGPLHCSDTLPAATADLAYAWRRDGTLLAGSKGADHTIVPVDEGHLLSCVITATNPWGSSTATSAAYRVPVTGAGGKARLALTGSARPGKLLRCGAALRISWLRDGHAIKGRHARNYRVRAADRGHSLACQTRRADGTLARSRAVRVPRLVVPKARGGQALAVTVTP